MKRHLIPEKIKSQTLNIMTFMGTPPFYIGLCLLLLPFSIKLCVTYLLAVVVTEIVCAIIKLVTRTERPTPRKRETLYDQYDASTFPSAHTARIASNVSIIVAAYPHIYFILAGASMILAVAYSRLALKEHYSVDVIVGAFVGIATSLLIYHWMF
ncbi:MAG TPA: phosphatase PAP2 family protein [Gammaproteobacteria bacterium]|nr:phosphatase PAP2 family protein [Gammaproteobacteria bacterium]